MAFNYTFSTPEHSYEFVPDLLDPDTVRITSEFKDSIESLLDSIELAGRADDAPFTALKLNIEEGTSNGTHYYIEISKADLALYLQFEVLNFMGAVPEL